MHDPVTSALLAPDEPPPFRIDRTNGTSAFFFICDHAGHLIPRALGDLGVSASELKRHIGWDIGAAGVTSRLAERLDAFAIGQTYSRLVIDCNRALDAATSIVTRSERTDIPGNIDLTQAQRDARAAAIFHPYHARIVEELDSRRALGRPTIVVTVHSFTPSYMDIGRPWHVGVLYHRDARLARPLLEVIRADDQWSVGDNQPYAVSDQSDYAIPVYGEQRQLPHVEIEVRQDLIADAAGQTEWGDRLADWLVQAARRIGD